VGNRAVITSYPYDADNVGVYVHWNGGRSSVEGFCLACKELGYRDPESDPAYGLARLTQAIGLFFGGELSLGIGIVEHMDASDNGVWVINSAWEIADVVGGNPGDVSDVARSREIADAIIARTRAAAKEGVA